MVAGKTVLEWLTLFEMSHNFSDQGRPLQWCWPYCNGDALGQPNAMIEIFAVIKDEIARFMRQKSNGKK